ncbi:MAG: alanine dehydrogenase [Planctomycetia bacterium]|nr:alanine dehydrogenase [Planctomycetia bacterium]
MIIGVPKEIKNNEFRVSMTPSGVSELVRNGHHVIVETEAGLNSGFTDAAYEESGAEITSDVDSLFRQADLIVKVKEPLEEEFKRIRPGQAIFTYFHFASCQPLTEAMMRSGAVCIAYETVEKADHSLPLLIPMSELAGRAAIQTGLQYLEKPLGGKGILLSGVPGVKRGKVLILGGGVVGGAAAVLAAGIGADVTICDISLPRLAWLEKVLPPNVHTLYASRQNIKGELPAVDLVIGAVLIPGGKAPKLITRDMLSLMEPGTVLVDVAIDQGGAFETSRPTSHDHPVYSEEGIIHYCVANIPGAFPRTSTQALSNATLPYVLAIADKGWKQACQDDPALMKGLNILDGKVCFKAVADAWDLPYTPVSLD